MTNLPKVLIVILLSCYLISLLFGVFSFSLAQTSPSPNPTLSPESPAPKKTEGATTGDFGLGAVEGAPKGLLVDVFVKIANWVISIVGFVLVVMLIYGGVMYMFGGISAGKEKAVNQGKQIITYAIIGIVIIFASYIIARFVIQAVGQ